MLCPSCGRKGRVPPERFNTTLHCKKCDAIFHMDSGGKVMLGEAPSARAKAEAEAKSATPKQYDPIGALASWIWRLPGVIRVLLLVGLLGGAGYGAYRSVRGLFTAVGSSLDSRVDFAVHAFADGSRSKLKSLAAAGTADDVDTWLSEVRPKFPFQGPERAGNTIAITGKEIVVDDREGGGATTVVVLIPPPAPNAPLMQFELRLPWIKENGEWKLAGKELLSLPSYRMR
jgi:hypothetical protein